MYACESWGWIFSQFRCDPLFRLKPCPLYIGAEKDRTGALQLSVAALINWSSNWWKASGWSRRTWINNWRSRSASARNHLLPWSWPVNFELGSLKIPVLTASMAYAGWEVSIQPFLGINNCAFTYKKSEVDEQLVGNQTILLKVAWNSNVQPEEVPPYVKTGATCNVDKQQSNELASER